MVEITANFERWMPGSSSKIPASIEQEMPAWTVTELLRTTVAIAIDLGIQPAIAIVFQILLSLLANHRKLM
jgi:hypothetical protein